MFPRIKIPLISLPSLDGLEGPGQIFKPDAALPIHARTEAPALAITLDRLLLVLLLLLMEGWPSA